MGINVNRRFYKAVAVPTAQAGYTYFHLKGLISLVKVVYVYVLRLKSELVLVYAGAGAQKGWRGVARFIGVTSSNTGRVQDSWSVPSVYKLIVVSFVNESVHRAGSSR